MILICQYVHFARRYVDVIHQSLRFGIWNMFIPSGHHPVNHCSLLDSWISLSRFGNHASFLYPFMIFYEWHIHSSSSCLCFFSTHLYFWLSNHYIGKRLLLFDDIACPLKTTFQKIDIFTPGELPFRFFFGRARFLHIAGIPRPERSWGVVFPPRISCWKAGTPTNHRIERENHLPKPPLLGSIWIFPGCFSGLGAWNPGA